MVYRIYLNVSYYCNVTYKNVYFTLRYIIVDISNKYIEETLMKDARLNRPLIKIFELFIASYFLIFHYLPITVKVFVIFSCFCFTTFRNAYSYTFFNPNRPKTIKRAILHTDPDNSEKYPKFLKQGQLYSVGAAWLLFIFVALEIYILELEHPGLFYLKSYVCWSVIQQSLNLRICLFYTFNSRRKCRQKSKRVTNDA